VLPLLDSHTWLNPQTNETVIIPESSEQWNDFHSRLDAVRKGLLPHREGPRQADVLRVISEVDELAKQVVMENADKSGLVYYGTTREEEPGSAPAAEVLESLPTLEGEVDQLLEEYSGADDIRKEEIKQRLNRVHEMLQSTR
jgi:hypothetical protein